MLDEFPVFIPATSFRECLNISITDDNRIEDTEQFFVSLNTTEQFVEIENGLATITIADNEGT